MTEADIRRQICEYLDKFPDRCIFRINVEDRRRTKSRYLPDGWPDISGSWDGRALFLEVKKPGGTIRMAQHDFMLRARSQGAIAAIVQSVEDVQEVLGGVRKKLNSPPQNRVQKM